MIIHIVNISAVYMHSTVLFCACLEGCGGGDQSPEFLSLVVWGKKLTS